MTKIHRLAVSALFAAIAAALLPSSPAQAQDWWPFGKKKTEVQVNNVPIARAANISTSYAPIVKTIAPSVVTIKTKRNAKPDSQPDFPSDDDDSQPQRALGSGVIVTSDGYILTNNHVVAGRDRILVDLSDNKDHEYEAKLVGADKKSDLAVLKIDVKDLPAATLGDSSLMEVGDVVLAIGNPFDIGQTVTMGIISGLGRNDTSILGQGSYANFIQTDAAINSGNSGGPLVDMQGRVIGINTAIISPNGGNLGIGFAIPINMARFIMEQLIANGKVTRGYLGVQIDNLDPDLASSYGRRSSQGVLITKVEAGTPADKAKLQRGDIITEVNDEPVKDAQTLRLAVSSLAPNTQLKVKYIRNGKESTATVVLGKLPDGDGNANNNPSSDDNTDSSGITTVKGLGFDIQALTPDIRRSLNLSPELNGVVIARVDPNSSAADKGLRRGTIILEVNDKPVTGIKDAIDAIKQGQSVVRLYIWDSGFTHYVALKKSSD
ncbi:MAG: Do family serine endopeptidase [Verrucomicrobiales bacterium]|jgi:serine protease Do|nr:Do family serine endopeptidase [Verrucomicrobiales bacterium]